MITNDKRREIAGRLRYVANDELGGMSLQKRIAKELELEDTSWRGVLRGIADLIDRPTCRDIGGEEGTNGEHHDFFCTRATDAASRRRISCRGHAVPLRGSSDARGATIARSCSGESSHGRTSSGTGTRSRVHGAAMRTPTAGSLMVNTMTSTNALIAENCSSLGESSMSHTRASAASRTCQRGGWSNEDLLREGQAIAQPATQRLLADDYQ